MSAGRLDLYIEQGAKFTLDFKMMLLHRLIMKAFQLVW